MCDENIQNKKSQLFFFVTNTCSSETSSRKVIESGMASIWNLTRNGKSENCWNHWRLRDTLWTRCGTWHYDDIVYTGIVPTRKYDFIYHAE